MGLPLAPIHPVDESRYYRKSASVAIAELAQTATSGRTSGASPSGCVCSAFMGEDREPRRVYSPADVGERLGVSQQRLRQLAAAYERVRGDLPRDDRRARVWPEESVEELERARGAVQEGRATGVEAALRGEILADGVEVPKTPARAGAGDIAALAELVEELRGLREAVEAQNRLLREQGERLEAIELENRELREAAAVPEVGEKSVEEVPVEEVGEVPDPPQPVPTGSTPTGTAPVQTPRGFLKRLLGLR